MQICELEISRFRGIPGKITVDFCKDGKPVSLLIFGDNGSGKSTIVDAIEFVTQGTVQGNRAGKRDSWLYNSISLKADDNSCVKVILSDGKCFESSIFFKKERESIGITGSVIREFIHAPFVLRRRSILNFWDTPNQQKLVIFNKYGGNVEEAVSLSPDEELAEIFSKRNAAKQRKRELLLSLATYFKLNPDDLVGMNKTQAFETLKLANHNRPISSLPANHPKYDDARELSKIYDEIQRLNAKKNKFSNSKSTISNKTWKERLSLTMKEISQEVVAAFKDISKTSDSVKEIIIDIAESNEVSMEFNVVLENGRKIEPTLLFSEANRDLLALLIYLEFIYHAENEGQAKVLVLDDIFQSVDSTIRYRVMQYVLKRFAGWQIIITTHDRLWKEQLTNLFRNHGVTLEQKEIVNWSFDDGPQIIGSKNSFDEKVIFAQEKGSSSDICAAAGYLLEYMCEKISFILNTSVQRRRDDKYTIGDLWPGIYKELKKSAASEVFSELNDLLYLRNMVGSHYNEWSLSLSRFEANDFAQAVLEAYYHLFDKEKGKWIRSILDIKKERL